MSTSIDLYWAHGEDRSVPLEETVAAFGALVADGRRTPARRLQPPRLAGRAGSRLAAAQGVEPYSALQLTTSYVEPRPGAPGARARTTASASSATRPWTTSPSTRTSSCGSTARWCRAATTARTGRSPRRTTTRARPRGSPRWPRSRRRAASRASQVVLAWLLARGWKPIVGVSTLEQLDSALAAASLELVAGGARGARRAAVRATSSAQGRTALSGFAGTAHAGPAGSST